MRIEPGKYIALALALLLAGSALVAAGCGSSHREERTPGGTLTIYVSLPSRGTSARVATAVAAGIRLALQHAHDRAGGHRIRVVQLDSTRPRGVTWDPSAVEENAKRAAKDPTTIAYIGELDLGASAISVPVTNDADILQVSPEDGLTSLTQVDPGGPAHTGPERYYPSGRRTFVRLVPTDLEQAAALALWAKQGGAHRLVIVHDDRLFGRALAAQAAVAAGRVGLAVADVQEASEDPAAYPGLAQKLAQKQPDAVLYAGIGDATAGALLTALERAMPGAALYGTSGLALASPPPLALPPIQVVKPAMPAASYGRATRRLLGRLSPSGTAPVEGLYGYEAMRLVLDAIDAAGSDSDDRVVVARAALRPRLVSTPFGPFRLLPTGDVSTATFGGYRDDGSTLRYEGPRQPGAALPPRSAAVG
jgi:branched-chain amino acid transport system substrate-binding protein